MLQIQQIKAVKLFWKTIFKFQAKMYKCIPPNSMNITTQELIVESIALIC